MYDFDYWIKRKMDGFRMCRGNCTMTFEFSDYHCFQGTLQYGAMNEWLL